MIENIQREDLNPLEIAQAYKKMVDELQYTQAEIAEKVGMDRASVTNYLRLLKLPDKIKDYLGDPWGMPEPSSPLKTRINKSLLPWKSLKRHSRYGKWKK
ncbi:ParB/RepB/Spo0J family partition protein [Acidobacteriota bacterium]